MLWIAPISYSGLEYTVPSGGACQMGSMLAVGLNSRIPYGRRAHHYAWSIRVRSIFFDGESVEVWGTLGSSYSTVISAERSMIVFTEGCSKNSSGRRRSW